MTAADWFFLGAIVGSFLASGIAVWFYEYGPFKRSSGGDS
jgi:hypothetical protein